MTTENDDILDFEPKEDRNLRLVNGLYGIAFLLFAYWYLADIYNWAFAGAALFSGLLILLAITVIRFISKATRALYEYAYFFGKLTLIAAVYISFMKLPYAYYIIFASFLLFLIGLILVSVQNKKK